MGTNSWFELRSTFLFEASGGVFNKTVMKRNERSPAAYGFRALEGLQVQRGEDPRRRMKKERVWLGWRLRGAALRLLRWVKAREEIRVLLLMVGRRRLGRCCKGGYGILTVGV